MASLPEPAMGHLLGTAPAASTGPLLRFLSTQKPLTQPWVLLLVLLFSGKLGSIRQCLYFLTAKKKPPKLRLCADQSSDAARDGVSAALWDCLFGVFLNKFDSLVYKLMLYETNPNTPAALTDHQTGCKDRGHGYWSPTAPDAITDYL